MRKRTEEALPARTLAVVAADMGAAREVLAARESAVQAAQAAYEASLDLGRTEALAARGHLSGAEVDRDIARRTLERLTAEHGAALEGERRAALAGVVGTADTAIAAYREACEELLPQMGRAARQLIRAWAEAERANEAAEAALQADLKERGVKNPCRCRPIVEAFRTWPGRPREVVGEPREFELWVNRAGQAPSDDWQGRIKTQGDGSGVLFNSGRPVHFDHKRVFREELVLKAQEGESADPLMSTLCIPGLTSADRAGWIPLKGATPTQVLAALDGLERPAEHLEDCRFPEQDVNPVGPPFLVRREPEPFRRIGEGDAPGIVTSQGA